VPRLAQQAEASHDFTNRARAWREQCCAWRIVHHLFSKLRFQGNSQQFSTLSLKRW
jgi:hypothetical protein